MNVLQKIVVCVVFFNKKNSQISHTRQMDSAIDVIEYILLIAMKVKVIKSY